MSPAASMITSVSPPPSGSLTSPASAGVMGPLKLAPPLVETQTGLGWSLVPVVSRPLGAVATILPLPIARLGSPKPNEPGSCSGVENPDPAACPGEATSAAHEQTATAAVRRACFMLGGLLVRALDALPGSADIPRRVRIDTRLAARLADQSAVVRSRLTPRRSRPLEAPSSHSYESRVSGTMRRG